MKRVSSHQLAKNCKLTSNQIDILRDMYDSGEWSYTRLARQFEISRRRVRDIISCRWALDDRGGS